MHRIATSRAVLMALALLSWSSLGRTGALAEQGTNGTAAKRADEPIQPLVAPTGLDLAKAQLGDQLFHDPILSEDKTIACASCHDLARGGADGRVLPLGIKGLAGSINTPTVLNAAGNFRQFWDGRAASLEEQIEGPLLSATEMGTTWPKALARLESDPAYAATFRRLYGRAPDEAAVREALATFERTLITLDSRFDRYLAGDASQLDEEEREGYRAFKDLGCASCHQGVNVGGNLFQVFGVMRDYFKDRGGITTADLGRYNVTHRDEDRHVFKVPSLRNVELTAPYFHDGSAGTLEVAVQVMGIYQLGRQLSPQEVQRIVKFLRTLTGHYTKYGTPSR